MLFVRFFNFPPSISVYCISVLAIGFSDFLLLYTYPCRCIAGSSAFSINVNS
ncbi:hypothetical protein M407DRAFT_241916 [Tulasnella calospora MUT 4182]|uniref:Uncharacterized protein n=1 Tax=Tulasnella calospora MUT 4182 TaxID=1051891 RepID=A0A0C3QRC8_9AGAM|nr:hypothetical protein M407DRAFT_242037 [Tulasnella calospora MUT 4182]KIO31251.1 hypothetical protein M407DRAFT_241916 [Tulasnella calospora MUT 4182]